MQFAIVKNNLVNILGKAKHVATKAIRDDLPEPKRVSFYVESDKIIVVATNGITDARFEMVADKNLTIIKKGSCTVDAEIFYKVAKSLGGENVLDKTFNISLEEGKLKVADSASKSKKNFATIETYSQLIEFQQHKINDSLFTYTFEEGVFQQIVKIVAPYSDVGYKPKLHQIVFQPFQDFFRFVTGKGSIFIVMEYPLKTQYNGETKVYFPAPQAEIISEISESQAVTIAYKDSSICSVTLQDGTKFTLKGLYNPSDYVLYDAFLAKKNDAKAVLDVDRQSVLDGCALVGSVKDKTIPTYQRLKFKASEEGLDFIIEEKKHACEYNCNAKYYQIKTKPVFEAYYAVEFFKDISNATNRSTLRFYCIGEEDSMIVECLDVNDKEKDSMGLPLPKDGKDVPKIQFFFNSSKK